VGASCEGPSLVDELTRLWVAVVEALGFTNALDCLDGSLWKGWPFLERDYDYIYIRSLKV
jgi:hypothetical protein